MSFKTETTFTSLGNLLPFLRPYQRQVFAAIAALILAASSVLAFGFFLKKHVDANLFQDLSAFLTMLVIICLLAFSSFSRFYLVSWVGERVVADLRQKVFTHILQQDISYFEKIKTGDLISRLTADILLLQLVITNSIPTALRNFLLMLGSVSMLFVTHFTFSLIIVFVVPLVLVPIIVFGRKVGVFSKNAQERLSQISAFVDEMLHAIRTLKAFSYEEEAKRHFSSYIHDSFEAAHYRIRARAFLTAFVILIVSISVMLLLWIGGHHVQLGKMSAGELSSFVFYAVLATTSVGALSDVVGNLQKAAGASSRLFDLLHGQSSLVISSDKVDLPSEIKGILKIENISFAYPARPSHKILEDFSLEIQQGEKIAIVGMSGAGKSTIFQLLLRFYDPQAGMITLDGFSLTKICPRALRTHIGFMAQESVIFSSSVRENIRYGHLDASEEEIYQAARKAHAYEFIQKLPEKFDTLIGERGILLSSGQRQRLALARIFLRNPSILLLDEPTSSLDSQSEKAIQEDLDRLAKGRTTLIIAHRLKTVQNADRIIVLDQGKIVEEGTHRTLLKKAGRYAHLAALNFLEAG